MVITASWTRLGVYSASISGLCVAGFTVVHLVDTSYQGSAANPPARQAYAFFRQPCFERLPTSTVRGRMAVSFRPAPPLVSVCHSVAQKSRDLEVGCSKVADSKGRGRTTSTSGHYCGVCHLPIGHPVCPNTPVSDLIYLQCRTWPSILINTAVSLLNVHTSEVEMYPVR